MKPASTQSLEQPGRTQRSLRMQARMPTWIGEVAGLRGQAPSLLELCPIGAKLVDWIVGHVVDPCCAVDTIADCQGPRTVPNAVVWPRCKGHVGHQAAAEADIDLHRACLSSTKQQQAPPKGSESGTQLVTYGEKEPSAEEQTLDDCLHLELKSLVDGDEDVTVIHCHILCQGDCVGAGAAGGASAADFVRGLGLQESLLGVDSTRLKCRKPCRGTVQYLGTPDSMASISRSHFSSRCITPTETHC